MKLSCFDENHPTDYWMIQVTLQRASAEEAVITALNKKEANLAECYNPYNLKARNVPRTSKYCK